MTESAACELLTIGHSNLAADRFVALLKNARVTAVADVRSVPFSRWCPWFSGKALAQRLAGETIAYIALGDALGGRPSDPRLYRDGVADYEAMAARAEFATGLERVVNEMAHHRVCLLCAESANRSTAIAACWSAARWLRADWRLAISGPTARSNHMRRRSNACSHSQAARQIFSAMAPSASPMPTAGGRKPLQRVSRLERDGNASPSARAPA